MRHRTGRLLAVALAALALVHPRAMPAQRDSATHIVPVNGIEMSYVVRGAGDPLVLLHGFSGCGRQWDPFIERLAERYKLIIPDLRGHGASTNPAGTFTHRQSAADVLALLDRIGVSRFRAMGISTGGMTLLHIATRHPERVEAMVLIGATSHFPEPARAIMRKVNPDSIPRAAAEDLRRCVRRGDAQMRQLMTQFNGFKDSYDDMNFTAPFLATIKARTLIVHGDRDEFFPVDIPVGMYGAIPQSALWIVPRGGHVPIYGPREPEFVRVALAFLQPPPTPR